MKTVTLLLIFVVLSSFSIFSTYAIDRYDLNERIDVLLEKYSENLHDSFFHPSEKISAINKVLPKINSLKDKYSTRESFLQKLTYLEKRLGAMSEVVDYGNTILTTNEYAALYLSEGPFIIIMKSKHISKNKIETIISFHKSGNDKERTYDVRDIFLKPTKGGKTISKNNITIGKSTISFVADEAGNYKFNIGFSHNGVKYVRSSNKLFTMRYGFDISKLHIEDGEDRSNIEEYITYITNQYWVDYEKTTSEQDIIKMLDEKYNDFSLIGIDDTLGILIEVDETSANYTAEIYMLKQEVGVSSVDYRIFEGIHADRMEF